MRSLKLLRAKRCLSVKLCRATFNSTPLAVLTKTDKFLVYKNNELSCPIVSVFATISHLDCLYRNEIKEMTKLSVNLNKIALLRNSRGRDFPNVVNFAQKFMDLGVQGITVHPRQDERHITQQDAYDLGDLLRDNKAVEYNIEGYPSADFMALVAQIKPTQCTLVPDAPDQLTSDHGWDLTARHAARSRGRARS